MKALRWHGRGDVRLDEVPEPTPHSPWDAVLTVEGCGVCGTDLEEIRHGPLSIPTTPHPLTGAQAPVTLGHEIVGRVVATGGRSPVTVGTRVVPTPLIPCGTCLACRSGWENRCARLAVHGLSADGGLAAAMRVDMRRCLPIPEEVSLTRAALAEPYAVVLHALPMSLIGHRVVIVGAGSIGLCAIDVARFRGATEVIAVDPAAGARAEARALGADRTVDPADADGLDADVSVEASGAGSGLATAVAAAARGGRVVLIGVSASPGPFPLTPVILKEVTIAGSVGLRFEEDFRQSVELLVAGKLAARERETTLRPLIEGPALVSTLTAGTTGKHLGKVVIQP